MSPANGLRTPEGRKREFLHEIAVGVVASAVGALAVRSPARKSASDDAPTAPPASDRPAAQPRLEGVPADAVALRMQLEAANLRVRQLTSELPSSRRQAPATADNPYVLTVSATTSSDAVASWPLQTTWAWSGWSSARTAS